MHSCLERLSILLFVVFDNESNRISNISEPKSIRIRTFSNSNLFESKFVRNRILSNPSEFEFILNRIFSNPNLFESKHVESEYSDLVYA
jgi:hypothetical protein